MAVTQTCTPENIVDNDTVLNFLYQHFEIYHLDRTDMVEFFARINVENCGSTEIAYRDAIHDALSLTNDQMKALSEKMSEIYSEEHFKNDLAKAALELNIAKWVTPEMEFNNDPF